MCVAVTLAPGTFLTEQECDRMNRSNADGVGVAWAKDGVVQWFKTTKVDVRYIAEMIHAWRDVPRLVHFRYATAGGTRPDLCHPFEIGPKANCAPTGVAARVMIHNGHWSRWDDVKSLLDKEGLLPEGPWSDSRLAAYLAHTDAGWLEALGGRVAVMEGDGKIARLGDWSALREGLYVSNMSWNTDVKYTRGGYEGYRTWKGWGWSEEEFEAYYKYLEEEDKREQEAIEASIRESAREARKAAKKEKRRGGSASGATTANKPAEDNNGGHVAQGGGAERSNRSPACGSQECLNAKGDGGCGSEGVCAWEYNTQAIPAKPQGKRDLSPDPWHNPRDGKWYRSVYIRGVATVVEAAPPSSTGAAEA